MSIGQIVRAFVGDKLSATTCTNQQAAHPGAHATDGLGYTYWQINTAANAVFDLTLSDLQTVDTLFLEGTNLGAGNVTVKLYDDSATELLDVTFAIASYIDPVGNLLLPLTSTADVETIEVTITGQALGATIRHMVAGRSFTPARNFWWDPEFGTVNRGARSHSIGGARHGLVRTPKKQQQLNWADLSEADAWSMQLIIDDHPVNVPILILAYPAATAGIYASRNFLAEIADVIGPTHTRGDYFDLSITFDQV